MKKYSVSLNFIFSIITTMLLIPIVEENILLKKLTEAGYRLDVSPYERYQKVIDIEGGESGIISFPTKKSGKNNTIEFDYFGKSIIKMVINKKDMTGQVITLKKDSCKIKLIDGKISNVDESEFCENIFSTEDFSSDKIIFERLINEAFSIQY